MNSRKLSVCLLVYNHGHIIQNTIKSILNQTYVDFEFIISDDNSTDNTYNVCTSIALVDERIRLLKTKNNLGMAGNANFAISNSNSEWIALLHHDDILSKDCLENLINIGIKNETIGFVFNDYKEHGPTTKKNLRIRQEFRPVMKGSNFLKKYLLKYWGCPVRGTALIRKKYFDEIGGMDLRFGMLSDVDLWMRLSAKWDVGYVDKPLIEVLHNRPMNYPKDYTEFSWKRIFILFYIHSANINKNNYPIFLQYLFKRFVFRNKLSLEIIKWHLYALYKNKREIIKSYPGDGIKLELFYVKFIRWIIRFFLDNIKNE